ncbi:MAG: TlpA disulfide reductase family protein [Deltaproteobacteria bacterium]|nr:TlpA disulfide reductase family protein [Deltaproteobacteria bacterium]
MKKLTPDQWMGVILALMAVGILALSVLDMRGGSAAGLRVAEGEPMLALEGPDLEGETLRFAAGDSGGKVLLIDFWATWCPPCVAEMPILASIHRELQAEGVEVIAVNADTAGGREGQARLVRGFLKQQQIDLPVLLDDGRNQAVYGIRSFPTLIVVGVDGKVSKIFGGLTSRDHLLKAIERAKMPAS